MLLFKNMAKEYMARYIITNYNNTQNSSKICFLANDDQTALKEAKENILNRVNEEAKANHTNLESLTEITHRPTGNRQIPID